MNKMQHVYSHTFLPYNYLAEEILLGSLIINPDFIPIISPIIQIQCLGFETHKVIYRYILELYGKNDINPMTFIYSLTKNKILKKIGGITKILHILQQSQIFISPINTQIYLEELVLLLHTNHIKRLFIQYGYNIIQLSYTHDLTTKQLHHKALKYLNCIVENTTNKNLDNFNNLIGNLLSNINCYDQLINIPQNKVYSGFKELDALINGLSNGDLIVISGRPSMGKTSLAVNIAYNLLRDFNLGTCIFSLEMSKLQILQKLISIASTIPSEIIKSGHINYIQWELIQHICNKLLRSQLYINDKSNISIDYIYRTTKLIISEKFNIKLIIIDYLQLIQINNSDYENRTQELSYITRQLKIIAKNLNLPVIILSQLNRNIETRLNKKPLLSDLRESGCIDINTIISVNNLNSMHITQIINNKTIPIYCFQGKSLLLKYQITRPQKIICLNQYIFNLHYYQNSKIHITHNHKLITINEWNKLYNINNNYNILQTIDYLDTKNIITEIILLAYTTLTKLSYVYDIHMYKYTNFICNKTIVHNSIEQDADIVMMLYKDEIIYKNQLDCKTLDIIIAKNRNGPIGSLQLLFYPHNNLFKSNKIT